MQNISNKFSRNKIENEKELKLVIDEYFDSLYE